MQNNKIYVLISICLFLIGSCVTKPEDNYRNKFYKTIYNSKEITDLGKINQDSIWENIPIFNLKWNDSSVNIIKIENYKELDSAYSHYKNSLRIDSSFFNDSRIISFGIITENGEIESYSYAINKDTIVLNCRVRKYPEKENGFTLPISLSSCVISLGNKK